MSTRNTNAALLCFGVAMIWPTLVSAIINATLSPSDVIARDSWCGNAHFGVVFLGHCAPCWTGSAAFVLAGALCLLAQPAVRHAIVTAQLPRTGQFRQP